MAILLFRSITHPGKRPPTYKIWGDIQIISFQQFACFLIEGFLFQIDTQHFQLRFTDQLIDVFHRDMELASEPYPYQAFFSADSGRTGNIDDPTAIESHALGPFELRCRLLLLGSFEDLVRIGMGSYLQLIVDRCGVAFGAGEYGCIQVDQDTTQVGSDTGSSRITVFQSVFP